MRNIEYDNSFPLARLEKGDKAIIRVTKINASYVKEKDRNKYKDVPDGTYEAVCTGPYYLKCEKYPALNGRYNFWSGSKWGCTEEIYADEFKQK